MNKKNLLSHAGGGGRAQQAFTMAEILLSLTIIGVVAAITLPSLTGNINERTWNTQRKALYARISQAMTLMPALNGFGTLNDTTDTAAETFVTSGLSKVLKLNNICDNEHLSDCGLPEKIISLTGAKKISFPKDVGELNSTLLAPASRWDLPAYAPLNSKAAAFETANGESVAVYYNPLCTGEPSEVVSAYVHTRMCANFIYDLNGSKGPNTAGKDIGFITVLYPTAPVVVAPLPDKNKNFEGYNNNHNLTCRKTFGSEYGVPNHDELLAIFANKDLFDMDSIRTGAAANVASSTKTYIPNAPANQQIWYVNWTTGMRTLRADHATEYFCVKR